MKYMTSTMESNTKMATESSLVVLDGCMKQKVVDIVTTIVPLDSKVVGDHNDGVEGQEKDQPVPTVLIILVKSCDTDKLLNLL